MLSKNKKTSEQKSDSGTSIIDWKLNDDEEKYVCENYVPKEFGLGSLARIILKRRNIEATEKIISQMKKKKKRNIRDKII